VCTSRCSVRYCTSRRRRSRFHLPEEFLEILRVFSGEVIYGVLQELRFPNGVADTEPFMDRTAYASLSQVAPNFVATTCT